MGTKREARVHKDPSVTCEAARDKGVGVKRSDLKGEVARPPLGNVKGDIRSLLPRNSAPASPPRPKHEARLSARLGTPNPTRGRRDAEERIYLART